MPWAPTRADGGHRYAPPAGLPDLRDALVSRARARYGPTVGRRQVLVTAGGTAACAAVLGTLLDATDRVLVPAPYWPLVPGLVRAFGGIPDVVPFFEPRADDPAIAVAQLASATRPDTVALYWNVPNNPTGRVPSRETTEAVIGWARDEGLWILSDRVLEDFVYRGEPVEAFDLAPERTFAVRSFSKTYAMAGYRCGWVLGPAAPMRRVTDLATTLAYAAPTPAQRAAAAALADGDHWLTEARAQYRTTAETVARLLGVPMPDAGPFLFLDVADALEPPDRRSLAGLLADCARRGLHLLPGTSCGPFPGHVRLCFTAAPPEDVLAGVEVLREVLRARRRDLAPPATVGSLSRG